MAEIDKTLLDEAYSIVSGNRNKAYGNAEDNFQNIANFWNAYLETHYGTAANIIHLKPTDVAAMMMCMKLARIAWQDSRDSKVDLIGYTLTLDRCEQVEKERKPKNERVVKLPVLEDLPLYPKVDSLTNKESASLSTTRDPKDVVPAANVANPFCPRCHAGRNERGFCGRCDF